MATPAVKRPVKSTVPYVCSSYGLAALASFPLQIKTGDCILISAIVLTDGTNLATLTLYNGTAATAGQEVACITVLGADRTGGETQILAACPGGIYATLTGTGSQALIRYI